MLMMDGWMLMMDDRDTKSTYLLTKHHHIIDKTTHTTIDPFLPRFPLSSHRYSNRVRVSVVLLCGTLCMLFVIWQV